jgi:hypothetical protein
VAVISSHSVETSSSWTVIPAEQVDNWNALLLQTTASYYQFPFWNEPFRQLRFRPVYLTYGAAPPRAYACILSFGIPGFRIGLLQRGPVALDGATEQIDVDAFVALAKWGREQGYVFLRVDAADAPVLALAARAGRALEREMFPLLRMPRRSFIVQLREDESKLLASFQTQVRQRIRTAERFGYEVSIGDSCDELKRAWPLVEMTARLKGFRIYRPLSNVLRAFELGRRHNCVRICTASLRGRPIQTVLLVRDGVRADYIYGGLDRQALGHSPSPGCLLHWFGIREALRLGCTYYDLGDHGDEKMRIFKSNFRPTEYIWPAPLTLVTNRALFPIWEKVILGGVGLLWPWIKMATARLLG